MTDDQLMSRIAKGDSKAFQKLFDRHSGLVFGYAMQLLNRREQAEDLSQEIWMKVLRQSPHYQPQGHFVAWLRTLTRNAAFNKIRNQKRWTLPTDSADQELLNLPSKQDLEIELIQHSEVERLQVKINELPEMQRVALVTWLSEDLSYDDLASHLDISVSALKSLLFRARKFLVDEMSEDAS